MTHCCLVAQFLFVVLVFSLTLRREYISRSRHLCYLPCAFLLVGYMWPFCLICCIIADTCDVNLFSWHSLRGLQGTKCPQGASPSDGTRAVIWVKVYVLQRFTSAHSSQLIKSVSILLNFISDILNVLSFKFLDGKNENKSSGKYHFHPLLST